MYAVSRWIGFQVWQGNSPAFCSVGHVWELRPTFSKLSHQPGGVANGSIQLLCFYPHVALQ